MIKMVLGVVRKPGMKRLEFHAYLKNVHGPLVLSVPEFLRHLSKYVQNHGLVEADGSPYRGVSAVADDRDAIIELWYDSVEEARRGLSEPRYLEGIRPDEAKFSDFQALFVMLTKEIRIAPRRDPAAKIKVFSFVKRKSAMSLKEFFKYRRGTHAPLLTHTDAFCQYVKGYVQNHVVPGNPLGVGGTGRFDGADEMWFADIEGVQRFHEAVEGLEEITVDEARFMDRSRTLTVLTEELTVHDTPPGLICKSA